MRRANTWVDISHIAGWPGNLTGIERVEFNLIKYYYEHDNAGFILWDKDFRRFKVIDRKFVKRTIIDRASIDEQHNKFGTSDRDFMEKVRHKLSRAVSNRKVSDIPPGRLIILAGLWDNADYAKGLVDLSKTHDLVHIVYDMIPLIKKEYVVDYLPEVFGRYVYKVLPVCALVAAISKSTAKDTKKLLESKGLDIPRISTFRLGDEITRAKKAVKPKGVRGEFILSVSTIEARKNHEILFYLQKKYPKLPKIIIAGKRGWLTERLQHNIAHDTDVKDKLIILDKTTDEELRWLYENCLFTIFPSFYEGWGLPVAESLNYGKVTLSSNASSMPEVGCEYADYFSPESVDELSSLVLRYMDPKKRQSREKIIENGYKPINWEESANEFAKLVEITNRK